MVSSDYPAGDSADTFNLQLFTRVEETDLGVSLNDQSQTTDISGMSTLVAM